MNMQLGDYVPVPAILKLNNMNVQYLDVLVYASIRSFNNKDENCYPSHGKIGLKIGLSKRFVVSSIKRLETAKLIKVERSEKLKKSNRYYFKGQGIVDLPLYPIPLALLTCDELTTAEKAMIICLRQFFEHGHLTTVYSINDFADYLDLSYATIHKQYRSLLVKRYINEVKVTYKGKTWGYTKRILHNIFDCGYNKKIEPVATVPRLICA